MCQQGAAGQREQRQNDGASWCLCGAVYPLRDEGIGHARLLVRVVLSREFAFTCADGGVKWPLSDRRGPLGEI